MPSNFSLMIIHCSSLEVVFFSFPSSSLAEISLLRILLLAHWNIFFPSPSSSLDGMPSTFSMCSHNIISIYICENICSVLSLVYNNYSSLAFDTTDWPDCFGLKNDHGWKHISRWYRTTVMYFFSDLVVQTNFLLSLMVKGLKRQEFHPYLLYICTWSL